MAYTKAPLSAVLTDANGYEINLGQGSGPFSGAPTSVVITDKNGNAVTVGAGGGGGGVSSVTASSPLASSGGSTPNITVSSSTGSGAVVLATSPTIGTPIVASFVNANHDHTNSAGGGTLAESALALTDVTTNNTSTSRHGFLPKLDNVATHFLDGTGTQRALAKSDLPVYNAADQGFFVSTGIMHLPYSSATAVAVVAAPQEVRAFQFILPVAMTIGKVTIRNGAAVASSTITAGIYSIDGNTKLIDSGTFDCSGNTNPKTNSISAVTLPPGPYYFAQSASTQTTLTANCLNNTNTIIIDMSNNQTVKKSGIAANPAVSGVLPSSLGIITASNAVFPLVALFER